MSDEQIAVALMSAAIFAGGKASGHVDDALTCEQSVELAREMFGMSHPDYEF